MMKDIGVSVIGMGWMGCVHARSFLQRSRFLDVPLNPRLVMCADDSAARAEWARQTFNFAACTTDWKEAVRSAETDIVCIAAPTFLHAEMVEEAAANGKHVYCEKPVGRNLAEAVRAEEAVRRAGVLSATGYNYRQFPMVRYCRQLLDEGKLGAVEHFNARFLSMYGSNPLSRLSWRFQNEYAGSGVIGDILSHVVDMSHYLVGPVGRVTATSHIFIPERPLPVAGASHFSLGTEDDPKGKVENEDYVSVLMESASGAVGNFQVSRVSRGPKCETGFDLYAEKGSVRWDFERMNELQLYLPNGNGCHDGFTRLLAGAAHPQHASINPGDGIGLGYEDSKVFEAADFLRDIAAGGQEQSGMAQALTVARVNDAVLRSIASGRWETVG